jgi:hypothetical protein
LKKLSQLVILLVLVEAQKSRHDGQIASAKCCDENAGARIALNARVQNFFEERRNYTRTRMDGHSGKKEETALDRGRFDRPALTLKRNFQRYTSEEENHFDYDGAMPVNSTSFPQSRS